MSGDTPPVFRRDGDQFVPTASAGSPWGAGLLHGGSPAGLLARGIERAAGDSGLQVSRLTIDLFRPVPSVPLTVEVRPVREGRRIAVFEAWLYAEGVEVSRASGLLLQPSVAAVELPAQVQPSRCEFESPESLPTTGLMARPGQAPEAALRPPGLTGFHTTVEVRRFEGDPGSGRGIAWFRLPVPFVEGEETSPLVRVAAISDLANGLGHIRASEGLGFINADINMHLYRLPEGEWICLETTGTATEHGLGLMETVVHDVHGPVGRVSQALLANQVRRE